MRGDTGRCQDNQFWSNIGGGDTAKSIKQGDGTQVGRVDYEALDWVEFGIWLAWIENSRSEVDSEEATHSPIVNMMKSTGPFFEAAAHAFWTSGCDVASPLTRMARPD